MYELTVRDHFDAAHSLRGYQGECSALHGHTWDVEVTVRGEALDEVGIVYDFKTLKEDLHAVLAAYDHVLLDAVAPFDTMNATAENLARVVFEGMSRVVGQSVCLVEVAVWESPIAKVIFRP
jgi:6-pyruvoyltetrahydropterin/6-carboxytetrahydropterin synthase